MAVVTVNLVPARNPTLKYLRLGPMGMRNHSSYAARHGYAFRGAGQAPPGRPECWAKIPAILAALADHEWVLWADSDTLLTAPHRDLADLVDGDADLVMQSPAAHFAGLRVDPEAVTAALPVLTGVFLVRRSRWSMDLLRAAWDRTEFVSNGPGRTGAVWDGVGEQEAVTAVLAGWSGWRDRVRYVDDLCAHPSAVTASTRFAHFYGNQAEHRISPDVCAAVIDRWEHAAVRALPLPADHARFHWCCIQNASPTEPFDRGGPHRFYYTAGEVDGVATAAAAASPTR